MKVSENYSLTEALKELNKSCKRSIKESVADDTELSIIDTDNLELEATTIEFEKGLTAEVNPCQLFANAVANAGYKPGDKDIVGGEDIINRYLENEGSDIRVIFVDQEFRDSYYDDAE